MKITDSDRIVKVEDIKRNYIQNSVFKMYSILIKTSCRPYDSVVIVKQNKTTTKTQSESLSKYTFTNPESHSGLKK